MQINKAAQRTKTTDPTGEDIVAVGVEDSS